MQEYDVKRGLIKNTDLKGLFEAHFGDTREEDGWFVGRYGNLEEIRVKYDKQFLVVETKSDQSYAKRVSENDPEALRVFRETHARWNTFLQDATGYDVKTRSKKAQERAKKQP